MTISSTTRTAGPFTGNGVAYLFPFAFKIFTAADLYVSSALIATGVQSTLALGTDYTVALNANQDSNPGGTVILTAGPLPVGCRLVISSDLANLQPTELINQGGFYPEVLTASLDRATIQVQQLQDDADRSLQFPITDPSTSNILPSAELRAGLLLGFDVDGAPIAVALLPGPDGPVGPPGTISATGSGPVVLIDTVTSTAYTLSVTDAALTVTPATGTLGAATSGLVLIDTVTGIHYEVSIANGAYVITEL